MLIHKYALNNVELTEPVLDNALRKEKEYLKSIKIDRLLAGFRETAGLSKTAERYPGGWEDAEIAGHTLGHYMTAQAQLFDATRDSDARNRLGNLLLGLAECQAENGYLFAAKEEIFDRVENGENAWVPWYTMHKIMAGLLSVYRYAKLPQALEIVGRMGEWVYYRTQKWSEETRAKVLSVEYGGMNDCLYDLFKETKFTQFLETAEKFDEKDLYRDVTEGKDILSGKHANTMIPKFVGALNRYIVMGDSEKFYLDAAKAFFDTVVKNHTYVIGGNSENEHFREPGTLGAHRSRCNCETCNTYNMLKLADRLYRITGEHKYMDFYERAYLNAILGSQNPETGMTTYFQPMESGYFKVFSKPFENFWCCTGTGMENFTKLNSDVYHVNDRKVYVNLYVASVLHEMNLDVDITQKTDLNDFENTEFSILAMGKSRFTICFRIPDWSAKTPTVTLNGAPASCREENGYLCLENEWKTGDKVAIKFYPEVRVSRLSDAPNTAAFTYGPFALAAGLGTADMRTETTGVNVTVPMKEVAVRESIIINSGTVDAWLNQCKQNLEKGEKLSFYLKGTDADEELVFSPYYTHYNDRYGIYFEFIAGKDLSEQERDEIDRKNGLAPKEKEKEKEEKTVSKKPTNRLFGNRFDRTEEKEEEEEEEEVTETQSKTNLVAPRPVYSTLPKAPKKEEADDVAQTSSHMTMSSPRPIQRAIAPARRDDDEDDVPQTSSRMTMSSPRPPQRPIAPVRRDEDEDDVPQTSSRMTMSSPRPPKSTIPEAPKKPEVDDIAQTASRMTMSSPRPVQRPIAPVRRDDDEDDVPQTSSRMTMSSPRPPQRPIPPVRRDEDEEDVPQTASRMTMSSPRPPKSTLPEAPKKAEADDIAQTASRMTMSSPRPIQRPIAPVRRDEDEDDVPQTSSRMTMSSPRPPQRPIAPLRRDDEETETEGIRTTSTRTASLRNPLRPSFTTPSETTEKAVEETVSAVENTVNTAAAVVTEAVKSEATVVELSAEEKEAIRKKLETELTDELRTSLKDEVGSKVRDDLRDELRPELTREVSDELRSELHDGLKDEVTRTLREELHDGLKDEVSDTLRNELRDTLKEDVTNELRSELHDGLKDEVSDTLRTELRDSLKEEIDEEVRGKLAEELRPVLTTEVTEKLRTDLTDSLKTEVSDKLRQEFQESLKEEVGEEVRGKLREELRPALTTEVTDTMKQELRESLKEDVTKEIREELHDGLKEEVTKTLRDELHEGLKTEVTETLRGEFRESLKDDVTKEIREELHEGLKEEVTQTLRSELHDGLKTEVTETLRGELRESLKDDVTKEIREELHEGLKDEVTKTLREELHDGLKDEVSETLRGELRISLKDEVTKEIHDELHDGLKVEVADLLRKEFRENLSDEIRAEIKAEIKEETKDEVAKIVVAEEVEAARVLREKEEARQEADREKREAEEQSRRDAEIKREEERLKLEEARNIAQLRAEEEKARQEEIRLRLETEELREKAKLRRMKEYEGKGKRLLRVLIPAICAIVALVLVFIFAAPISKGIFGMKNGVDRFLFNKMPGVAKALGIKSGEKIVPVFVSTEQKNGVQLLENPEDFVRSVSPALGYTASLKELNGLTCLCMEGEGVRVYYPTELTESGMKKYVYVENDSTFSMNFWEYDFTNPASLCPKKEIHNNAGREQYVFNYFSPEKTFHILDAETLKENELEPVDTVLNALVQQTGCQENEGKAELSVVSENLTYNFRLPVSTAFAASDYALVKDADASYKLTDNGIRYESFVTAGGTYIGKVVGEYQLQNRMYVPKEFRFYALADNNTSNEGEYIFHGASEEDAKKERHGVYGEHGEHLMIP